MKFPVFQILFALKPVVEDIVAAARADSPGGKRITRAEWREIRQSIAQRLLADDIADLID